MFALLRKMKVMLSLLFVSFVFLAEAIDRDFYSYKVKTITDDTLNLEQLRGSVSLVVNVASKCGYTDSHYRALSELQEVLGSEGKFHVIAFPCNQFGGQEPNDNFGIMQFITNKYYINFKVTTKVDVLGENAEPAFRNLIEQSGKEPDWNFWKYLVNPEGKVVNAWGPKHSVDSIFDDIMREVTKAGGSVQSTLGDKGFPDDEL